MARAKSFPRNNRKTGKQTETFNAWMEGCSGSKESGQIYEISIQGISEGRVSKGSALFFSHILRYAFKPTQCMLRLL